MMCLYKDQCKWISNSTKFPLVGVGVGECLLLATQLLTQNFFQVKLIQPGLEFSTAGLAPPPLTPPPPGVYIYWQHLPLPRGSFCLWSRKVEKTEGICSSDLHQGDMVRVKSMRLGVSSGGGEVQIFKSRPCTYLQASSPHLVTPYVPNAQPPSRCNKSSGLTIMRPIARSRGGNCSFRYFIRARWEHHSDL